MKTKSQDLKHQNEKFIFERKSTEERGAKLKKHIHPFYEVMCFDGGEAEFVIEDRQYVVKRGDVLLIKPAKYHFCNNVITAPYKRYCLIFSEDVVEDKDFLKNLYAEAEMLSPGEDSVVFKLMRAMSLKLETNPQNDGEFGKAMINAILLAVEDGVESAPEKTAHENNNNFTRILNYVNSHLNSINSVEDISVALFLSKSYVMHIFKSELKIGVMQYVRNKKILFANEEMKKGKKPTDIYQECGFTNYSTFYRAYLAYFGHSPRGDKHS